MRKTPAFLLSGALATALTIAALPATASDSGNGEWTQLKSAPEACNDAKRRLAHG